MLDFIWTSFASPLTEMFKWAWNFKIATANDYMDTWLFILVHTNIG